MIEPSIVVDHLISEDTIKPKNRLDSLLLEVLWESILSRNELTKNTADSRELKAHGNR